MLLISHRGNTSVANPSKENHPDYIMETLNKEYMVEVDVWFIENKLYLGHDEPLYDLNSKILDNKNILFHAKNYDALNELKNLNLHYFWHQNDDYTITSKGLIWVYPGKKYSQDSIVVLPELFTKDLKLNCFGVCSDFIENYK